MTVCHPHRPVVSRGPAVRGPHCRAAPLHRVPMPRAHRGPSMLTAHDLPRNPSEQRGPDAPAAAHRSTPDASVRASSDDPARLPPLLRMPVPDTVDVRPRKHYGESPQLRKTQRRHRTRSQVPPVDAYTKTGGDGRDQRPLQTRCAPWPDRAQRQPSRHGAERQHRHRGFPTLLRPDAALATLHRHTGPAMKYDLPHAPPPLHVRSSVGQPQRRCSPHSRGSFRTWPAHNRARHQKVFVPLGSPPQREPSATTDRSPRSRAHWLGCAPSSGSPYHRFRRTRRLDIGQQCADRSARRAPSRRCSISCTSALWLLTSRAPYPITGRWL